MVVQSRAKGVENGGVVWYPAERAVIPFPLDFFESRDLDVADCKLVLMADRSMAPAIDRDDVVMIDTRTTDLIIDDDVYCVLYHGEMYLRRIRRRPSGGYTLTADNLEFEPFVVSPSDRKHLQVLGRKVWRGG